MAHVVHLTSVHPPYDVRIFLKECCTLVRAGYRVTLVVTGEVDAERNGVQFVSVPAPRTRAERMALTAWRVYRAALALDADLYHFHDPELIPIGLLLKLHGKPVVYDVHEEVPEDILDKAWIPAWLRLPVAFVARVVTKIAGWVFDGVVASRPSLLREFPPEKTALVNNYPMLGELDPPVSTHGQRGAVAAYVGMISPGRGLPELMEALARLPDAFEFVVEIAGPIDPPELEQQLRQMPGWRRVRYLGWQSRQQVADLLARARFGIVLFLPTIRNHTNSVPTKLFEFMSAGLPVLGTDLPLWRDILERQHLGRVVDPFDADAVAAAIQWMMEHDEECLAMGQRGRRAVVEQYSWDVEAARLLQLYEKILRRS